MAKELYVGHISERATEEDLRKLFELMGVVTSVHLIVDEQTGEFKRCGYVRMLSEVNLNEVVETLDGTYLIDRCIVVSIAKPQKDRPAKKPFIKRTTKMAARPATTESGTGDTRRAEAKHAGSARPSDKETTKTGRSSAAKEAIRKSLPKAIKGTATSDRPASAARRPERQSVGKRQGDRPQPPSKGHR